jgi:hypothetical protein
MICETCGGDRFVRVGPWNYCIKCKATKPVGEE